MKKQALDFAEKGTDCLGWVPGTDCLWQNQFLYSCKIIETAATTAIAIFNAVEELHCSQSAQS